MNININLHCSEKRRLVDILPDVAAVLKAVPESKLYYNGKRMVVSCCPDPRWIKLRIGELK